MEVLRQAPKPTDFVPLVEHQSTTPASFYEGPPVLHYYSDRCKVLILDRDLTSAPGLAEFVRESATESATNGTAVNGAGSNETDEEVHKSIEDVDIWVTSSKLLLFCNTSKTGVSIPYPSISLHAIQSLPEPSAGEQQGLYMLLISFSAELENAEEDLEPDSISMTLIPTASAPPVSAHEETEAEVGATADEALAAENEPEQTPVVALFTALSNCSNLHSDPVDPHEEGQGGLEGSSLFQAGMIMSGSAEGGLPPAMPGSGGWITAENMHEFFDEEGNYIGPDDEEEQEEEGVGLGPGAGTVRARDEEMDDQPAAGDAEESKWQRTG